VTVFFLVLVSFAVLTVAYVASDFSVVNVYENSHSAKPLLFKITGVWGNHEGSMLLWVLILVFFGALVGVFGGNLPDDLRATTLAVQGWISAGFLLFHAGNVQPVQPVMKIRQSKAMTSTRSCRTSVWRSIRRCSMSAMSVSRSPSPLPSLRSFWDVRTRPGPVGSGRGHCWPGVS
jgi:hypothetical protein